MTNRSEQRKRRKAAFVSVRVMYGARCRVRDVGCVSKSIDKTSRIGRNAFPHKRALGL